MTLRDAESKRERDTERDRERREKKTEKEGKRERDREKKERKKERKKGLTEYHPTVSLTNKYITLFPVKYWLEKRINRLVMKKGNVIIMHEWAKGKEKKRYFY